MKTSFLFSLLCAFGLLAHDLYVMPKTFRLKPGAKVQIAFHNGDGFPISQGPPPLARMLDAQLLSSTASTPIVNLRADGKTLIGDSQVNGTGTLIASIHSKPNGLKLDAPAFTEYLKHEGLQHVVEWREKHGEAQKASNERYSKFAKSLLVAGQPSDFYKHPLGFTIEILPQSNPSLMKPGATLPIQLLFRGKPAAGLQIEAAWATPEGKANEKVLGRTDANGVIDIPVTAKGTWKLSTVLMERCQDPSAAEWESFWASLTFEIQ